MKINSARAGCNRPRPSETLRQRWGLTEWGDMQSGCVHISLGGALGTRHGFGVLLRFIMGCKERWLLC